MITENKKYIENFNTKYIQNIFPGQSLMDLNKMFNIDYNFNFKKMDIPITIDNDQKNNFYIKYGYLDETYNKNKISYKPMNANKVYENKLN
jgi:hypothetical protein